MLTTTPEKGRERERKRQSEIAGHRYNNSTPTTTRVAADGAREARRGFVSYTQRV